jgi:hypothetical protein
MGRGLTNSYATLHLFGEFLIVANLEIDSLYGALIKLFFRERFKSLVNLLKGD